MSDSRIVVVLGMHRSGTSAVTAMLRALGVELGDRLMPAHEQQNPRGYFEDIDIVELNTEMLIDIGSDWDRLTPLTPGDVDLLFARGYAERARALLAAKQAIWPIFGFKDPRAAKLLAFWKRVLDESGQRIDYVLAIRHPRSVAESLLARDGIDTHLGYLLWLGHVLPTMQLALGSHSVVCDYDMLLSDPEAEVSRIGQSLDLTLDREQVGVLAQSFLDEGLRHSHYVVADLDNDKRCPPLVRKTYASILELARSVDATALKKAKSTLKLSVDHFANSFATLKLIDEIGGDLSKATKELEQHRQQRQETLPVRRFYLQIYFDRGHGMSEADSQKFDVDVLAPSNEIRVDLQHGEPVIGLRIDPLNDSAIVTLEDIALSRDGVQTDWLTALQSNADSVADGRYYFLTGDPQISVGVDPELLSRAHELGLKVSYQAIGLPAVSGLATMVRRARELEQQVAERIEPRNADGHALSDDHAQRWQDDQDRHRRHEGQIAAAQQQVLDRERVWAAAVAETDANARKERAELLAAIAEMQREQRGVVESQLSTVETYAERERQSRQAQIDHERALHAALLEGQARLLEGERDRAAAALASSDRARELHAAQLREMDVRVRQSEEARLVTERQLHALAIEEARKLGKLEVEIVEARQAAHLAAQAELREAEARWQNEATELGVAYATQRAEAEREIGRLEAELEGLRQELHKLTSELQVLEKSRADDLSAAESRHREAVEADALRHQGVVSSLTDQLTGARVAAESAQIAADREATRAREDAAARQRSEEWLTRSIDALKVELAEAKDALVGMAQAHLEQLEQLGADAQVLAEEQARAQREHLDQLRAQSEALAHREAQVHREALEQLRTEADEIRRSYAEQNGQLQVHLQASRDETRAAEIRLQQEKHNAAQAELAWLAGHQALEAQMQNVVRSATWRLRTHARKMLGKSDVSPSERLPARPPLQWQTFSAQTPSASEAQPSSELSLVSDRSRSLFDMRPNQASMYHLRALSPTDADELLDLYDEAFIVAAYDAVLGRAPDEEGLRYYLRRLRRGVSKLETLSQLRRSTEGASRSITMPGLDSAIDRYRKSPLRTLEKWFSFGRRQPSQQLDAVLNQLYISSVDDENRFDRIDHALTSLSLQLSRLQPLAPAMVQGSPTRPFNQEESTAAVVTTPDATGESSTETKDSESPASSAASTNSGSACVLEPINELIVDGVDGQFWTSLGEDPYFSLKFADGRGLSAGWYCVQVRLDTGGRANAAKFYFNSGAGFSESETLVIPYVSDESSRRWFYCNGPVLDIRFDPQEGPGRFKIDFLDFAETSEDSALADILAEVQKRHFWYREKELAVIRDGVEATTKSGNTTYARALLSVYDGTFNTQGLEYHDWIRRQETPSLPSDEAVEERLASMGSLPLISVIVPAYNTPEIFLRECIDSVRQQSYPNWELCIADDASPKPHVRRVLLEYAGFEPRIRFVTRSKNGHISRASNSALELAQGDYVALLDHDDTLPRHALYFVACAIEEAPDTALIYSDEDKLDEHGSRFSPHFKSDWNPDMLLACNYVSHLGVYRRDLLTKIGGFRAGVEGSQDHDLVLRCLPHIVDSQIVHIPRILYHWRAVEGSTAVSSDAKTYTSTAAIRALKDHFKSTGVKVLDVTAGVVANTYRTHYAISTPAPLVSLLIPTRDKLDLLKPCVESILRKSTYQDFEILILDNGSVEPETIAYFKKIQKSDKRVRVFPYDAPFNYSAINNFGVKASKGSIIGLVNNDIEVISPDWLTEMVSHAVRPGIGCVGAKLYYANDTIQHAGVICSLGGLAAHSHKHFPRNHSGYMGRLMLTQNLSAVTAACLLVKREIFDQVGGLDENNLTVAFNDVDFCLKVVAAGYRNLWTPYAELYHYESISRGSEDTPEKRRRFEAEIDFMKSKWGDKLEEDPYYNPNLTKSREDFSMGN